MANVNSIQKIEYKEKGVPLSSQLSNLKENQVQALRKLGINTTDRLHAMLEICAREISNFIGIPPEETANLNQILCSSLQHQLDPDKRKELNELACPLGLSLEDAVLQAVHQSPAESDELLEAIGMPAVSHEVLNAGGYILEYSLPDIRHQGKRGTCVAHAVVRCAEHLFHKNSQGSNLLDLSEQYLYWHIKNEDNAPNEGSTLLAGGKTIYGRGTCLEKSCPYHKDKYTNDRRQMGPEPDGSLNIEAANYRPNKFHTVDPRDLDALKRLLVNDIAVAYGIAVFRSWEQNPSVRLDGVISMPIGPYDTKVGGHAITLVGFVDSDQFPGGGGFIFDNSWGTEWAQENYFGAGKGILPYNYARSHSYEAIYLT